MKWIIALDLVLAAAAVAEYILPGRPLYQVGWFNALAVALAIGVVVGARRLARRLPQRVLTLRLLVAGAFILALALAQSGLFAPGPRRVIAVPGARVPVPELGGTVAFGLRNVHAGNSQPVVLTLHRRFGGDVAIGPGRAGYAGEALAWQIPRRVVVVAARNPSGAPLTVTQPSGTTFLSPVLTMRFRQRVAGLSLPFDTFAVPALHRIVRVVLFGPHQAAALRGLDAAGGPVVLFAVDDQNDRPIPNGIGTVRSGRSILLAGVRLRGSVTMYPALEVVAVPYLPALLIGLIMVGAGLFFLRSVEPVETA